MSTCTEHRIPITAITAYVRTAPFHAQICHHDIVLLMLVPGLYTLLTRDPYHSYTWFEGLPGARASVKIFRSNRSKTRLS